ncbi:response regulator transcription factor [Streptomyces mirabilis]|uniref:response regulator transcription factor n=1 Tax=Streptomyces mirabilis TaxID=68239 RepID=UPI0036C4997D
MAEDDNQIALPLLTVLRRQGFGVRHARTAREALEALASDDVFAAALVDVGLPDMDGFAVCARIISCSLPVIMMTARANLRSRIHGLYLGADDCISKPFETAELIARIRAVIRRRAAQTQTPTSRRSDDRTSEDTSAMTTHGVSIDIVQRRIVIAEREIPLTRKEFDLLALLAEAPGIIYRREHLLSRIWHDSGAASNHTLEAHVASLRAKLAIPGLVQTIRGVGYRLAADVPSREG